MGGGGGGGVEKGVSDAWRLPLICHKDGKHVMITNAGQIGLEKQAEERAGGAETDGIVGSVPAIPSLFQSGTCCLCLCASNTCEHKRGRQGASPHADPLALM